MKTLNLGQGNRTFKAVASGILLGATFLFSTSLWAVGIAGSVHDFSSGTGGAAFNTTGEICKVCHLPHNALSPADGPLWNRTMSAVANYTAYTSTNKPGSDINNTMGQPEGVSKLCLSCHDGTVALDAFGGNGAGADGNIETLFSANRNIGNAALGATSADLSNDHPVSFQLVDNLDTKIKPINTLKTAGLVFFGTGTDRLECATCHNVHNDSGNAKLLRVANNASGLCLTCHIK